MGREPYSGSFLVEVTALPRLTVEGQRWHPGTAPSSLSLLSYKPQTKHVAPALYPP